MFKVGFPLVVVALVSCTKPTETAPVARDTARPPDVAEAHVTLTRVADPSEVCMVNDQYMAKPQIAVAVGERTYYGCCEMCKGRLMSDPTARTARDPVSGATVDKAIAVIARTSTGKVLYFESEATLGRYASASR